MLADMGADVIKVERPPHGDDTRKLTPPAIGGESAAFMMMNRNKRGVAIDLKTDCGREVLRKLIATADAVSSASPATWAVLTTASTSQIAADESRMSMLIYNASNVRVYLRFDSTAPLIAGTNAHWYLDAGDRWEVPDGVCQLAISIIAATAGSGTVNFTLGTET
jgi:hypothetical protein